MAGLVPGALIGGKQAASLQREVSRWRIERGTGETNLDFEPWLKVVNPQKWQQLSEKRPQSKRPQ